MTPEAAEAANWQKFWGEMVEDTARRLGKLRFADISADLLRANAIRTRIRLLAIRQPGEAQREV